MKRKDFAVIAVIIVISAVLSFVLSKSLFGGAKVKQEVERVQPITKTFTEPDDRYFNPGAFNPTKKITIGDSNSEDPFKKR